MDEASAVARARAVLAHYPIARWVTIDRLIVAFRRADGSIAWRASLARKVNGVDKRSWGLVRPTWTAAAEDRAELEAANPTARNPHDKYADDTVSRIVDMLGWSTERRREMFSAPVSEDLLYDIGIAVAEMLRRDLTLEEVGTLYGVTRERIRQVQAAAVAKLRDAGVMVGHE